MVVIDVHIRELFPNKPLKEARVRRHLASESLMLDEHAILRSCLWPFGIGFQAYHVQNALGRVI